LNWQLRFLPAKLCESPVMFVQPVAEVRVFTVLLHTTAVLVPRYSATCLLFGSFFVLSYCSRLACTLSWLAVLDSRFGNCHHIFRLAHTPISLWRRFATLQIRSHAIRSGVVQPNLEEGRLILLSQINADFVNEFFRMEVSALSCLYQVRLILDHATFLRRSVLL